MPIEVPDKKIYVKDMYDIYDIMQRILIREYKNGRKREYFWGVGLDLDHTISYIELIAMGSKGKVVIETKEAFSIAVEKRVKKMFFIHNHPVGTLEASEGDIKTTKALIKAGLLLDIPLIDHLIINEEKCYSMLLDGPMLKIHAEVRKEAPELFENEIRAEAKEEGLKEGEEKKAIETAKKMLAKGMDIGLIIELTGLPMDEVEEMK